MATTYPGTIDSFTNPSGTNTLDDPDHSLQHSDANDAIEAIEAVIGTTAGTSVLKDFSAGEFPVRQNTSNVLQDNIASGSATTFTMGTAVVNQELSGSAVFDEDDMASDSNSGVPTQQSVKAYVDSGTVTMTNKTLTSPVMTSPTFRGSIDGWVSANETWEYVSVDDPTGIFRVNADVTGKYSAGMRIKFTNNTYVIYGIVTVVGSYSGGYTSITFLHQIDPTDSLALYLMANSAITANYYSTQKAPFGFPLSPDKWSVELTLTSASVKVSASAGTWYNEGSNTISIPIGEWLLSYQAIIGFISSSSSLADIYFTLSTANNNNAVVDLCSYMKSRGGTGASSQVQTYDNVKRDKHITLTSKTTYYINFMTTDTTSPSIGIRSDDNSPTIIRATCAYL